LSLQLKSVAATTTIILAWVWKCDRVADATFHIMIMFNLLTSCFYNSQESCGSFVGIASLRV
jgi:hypothetical protein